MKKSNNYLIRYCIGLFLFIVYLFSNPLEKLLSPDSIFSVIVLIIIMVVCGISTFSFEASRINIKTNGKLMKGFIIAINDHYHSGDIDIYVDGRVYTFCDSHMFCQKGMVEKNHVFVKLFETFHDRYSIYNDELLLKGIPIDVYVYKNKISPIFESVKVEDI